MMSDGIGYQNIKTSLDTIPMVWDARSQSFVMDMKKYLRIRNDSNYIPQVDIGQLLSNGTFFDKLWNGSTKLNVYSENN